ncbi:MAG: hypothetical protein ACTSV7_15100 [Candidatus Baldrarchaeia archaeon]
MFESRLEIDLVGILEDEKRQVNFLLDRIVKEGERKKITFVDVTKPWTGDNYEGLGRFTVRYDRIEIYSYDYDFLLKLQKRIKELDYFIKRTIKGTHLAKYVLRGGAESTALFNPFLPK